MRTSDGRPERPARLIGAGLAIVAGTVLLGAAPRSMPISRQILDFAEPANAGNGGAGGVDAFGILLLAGLVLAVLVVIVAGVILVRTRGVAKAVPPPLEGWWTCANCGAGNMDGAARCHNCAAWRAATPRSTSPAP